MNYDAINRFYKSIFVCQITQYLYMAILCLLNTYILLASRIILPNSAFSEKKKTIKTNASVIGIANYI
jgi:hypothetical protein